MIKKQVIVFPILFLILCFFNYFFRDSLNMVSFFLLLILLPAFLFSVVISVILANFPKLSKKANMNIVISSILYLLLFGVYLNFLIDKNTISKIISNTKNLVKNSDIITMSNIHIENNVSSFIMIGLVVFVLTELIYRLLKKRKKK